MDKYFLTTAIYYINDKPHLGSVSEVIAADFVARYQRKLGKSVLFSTGTDEHSQKVERSALALGSRWSSTPRKRRMPGNTCSTGSR